VDCSHGELKSSYYQVRSFYDKPNITVQFEYTKTFFFQVLFCWAITLFKYCSKKWEKGRIFLLLFSIYCTWKEKGHKTVGNFSQSSFRSGTSPLLSHNASLKYVCVKMRLPCVIKIYDNVLLFWVRTNTHIYMQNMAGRGAIIDTSLWKILMISFLNMESKTKLYYMIWLFTVFVQYNYKTSNFLPKSKICLFYKYNFQGKLSFVIVKIFSALISGN